MIKSVAVVAFCFAVVSLFAQVPAEDVSPLLPAPVIEAPAEVPDSKEPVPASEVEPRPNPDGVRQVETNAEPSPLEISGNSTGETALRFLEGSTLHTIVGGYGTANPSYPSWAGAFRIINVNNAFMVFGTNNTERMRIHNDGNVSIGGASNSARLAVWSSGDGKAAFYTQQSAIVESAPGSPQVDYGMIANAITDVQAGVTSTGGSAVGGSFGGYNNGAGTLPSTYGANFYSGNISTAPSAATVSAAYGVVSHVLSGPGTVNNGYGLWLTDVQATTDWGLYQAGANDDNYFAGRVGIGTAPAEPLHLSAPSNGGIRLTHTDTASIKNSIFFYENSTQLGFINQRGSTSSEPRQFNLGNSHTSGSTALYAGGSTRIFLQAGGNVGIGTSTPAAKLHVDGSILATGSITGATVLGAVYQDVAEWVPATTDMEPGTVVVLNHDSTNEVMPSHGSYDTSVAGVVSAQPGLILGVGGASKEQIATTGRVKVRVDATGAPIRVGDLLVTSDISGTAMRSEPMEINGRRFHQPGTIIGKALEPLASGTGEILVLLSLQ